MSGERGEGERGSGSERYRVGGLVDSLDWNREGWNCELVDAAWWFSSGTTSEREQVAAMFPEAKLYNMGRRRVGVLCAQRSFGAINCEARRDQAAQDAETQKSTGHTRLDRLVKSLGWDIFGCGAPQGQKKKEVQASWDRGSCAAGRRQGEVKPQGSTGPRAEGIFETEKPAEYQAHRHGTWGSRVASFGEETNCERCARFWPGSQTKPNMG